MDQVRNLSVKTRALHRYKIEQVLLARTLHSPRLIVGKLRLLCITRHVSSLSWLAAKLNADWTDRSSLLYRRYFCIYLFYLLFGRTGRHSHFRHTNAEINWSVDKSPFNSLDPRLDLVHQRKLCDEPIALERACRNKLGGGCSRSRLLLLCDKRKNCIPGVSCKSDDNS